jgi:hypothetical protein
VDLKNSVSVTRLGTLAPTYATARVDPTGQLSLYQSVLAKHVVWLAAVLVAILCVAVTVSLFPRPRTTATDPRIRIVSFQAFTNRMFDYYAGNVVERDFKLLLNRIGFRSVRPTGIMVAGSYTAPEACFVLVYDWADSNDSETLELIDKKGVHYKPAPHRDSTGNSKIKVCEYFAPLDTKGPLVVYWRQGKREVARLNMFRFADGQQRFTAWDKFLRRPRLTTKPLTAPAPGAGSFIGEEAIISYPGTNPPRSRTSFFYSPTQPSLREPIGP